MTYQDPKLPDPGLGRNPPRYSDSYSGSFGPGSIVAMIVGAVVIIGAIAYAVSGPAKNTASNPPPVTTGQGGTPVAPRIIPLAPTTPEPVPAPAPKSQP
jgi:hypothetical protein